MTTKRLSRRLATLLAAAVMLADCAGTSGPGGPAAPIDGPVTAENLLASERDWPYRVQLREAWTAPGRERPLSRGRTGVLVRVEASGDPRIDFGGLGRYEVPLGLTDLVERANRVRRGELRKWGPNFVHAIRTRLLDPRGDVPRQLDATEVDARRGFLCVFARPDDERFAELARALAPLSERHADRVLTILFPLGRVPNREMHARLAELGWRVPFLFDFLAEGYARSLLTDPADVPSLMLQTPDGRVLHRRSLAPGDAALLREAASELAAVLAAEYGDAAPTTATSD